MKTLKIVLFGFAFAGMFLLTACETDQQAGDTDLSEELRAEQQELKKELQQLEKDINAELRQLEAQLESESADAKSDIQSEIDDLKETKKKVSAQLKEIGDATAENWEKFENDVRGLIGEIKSKLQ